MPGCGFGGSSATELSKNLKGVRCSEFVGSSRVLDSGVSLSCSRVEMLVCALQYNTASTSIALQRDADAWGVADCPGVVMIHDRYASNEDRLVLIDLTQPTLKEKEVVHEDWANYIHSHFSVIALHGDRITVHEMQYAGTQPPRARAIEVSLSSLSVSRVWPWQERAND